MQNRQRRILCLDMDAFFASVEQASRPYLRKTPMAVAGAGERTVILSASYMARQLGIRTGFTLHEALRLCPELKIIPASAKKYSYVSSRIGEFLKTITPDARMFSIDEAFMDITHRPESSPEIGYRIKAFLKKNFKITGSVGIGETYLLAKMASEVNKPDGFYEVMPDERLAFIDRFKLKEIWGIGRRTTTKLASLGLFSPADVRRFGQDALYNLYGIPGIHLYLACCGLDKDYPVGKEGPLKSISHSITAPKDIYTEDLAFAYLLQLSEAVSRRARTRKYCGRTLSLYVRDSDLAYHSYHRNLGFFTSATHHIYEAAKQLFKANVTFELPIRLIGVGISHLIPGGVVLANLEDTLDGNDDKIISLYQVLDEINEKYANGLIRGSVLKIAYREPTGIPPTIKQDTYWGSLYTSPAPQQLENNKELR